MAYVTITDLGEIVEPRLLVQLADDNGDGVADEAVIAKAITDAEGEVNGYLAGRYSVPFADGSVPALVVIWTGRLAVFNLKRRRYQTLIEDDRKAYDSVVKQLQMVNSGKMDVVRADEVGGEKDLPERAGEGSAQGGVFAGPDATGMSGF